MKGNNWSQRITLLRNNPDVYKKRITLLRNSPDVYKTELPEYKFILNFPFSACISSTLNLDQHCSLDLYNLLLFCWYWERDQ